MDCFAALAMTVWLKARKVTVGTARRAFAHPTQPRPVAYAALLPSWRLASNRNQVRRSVSSMKLSNRPAVPESS